MFYLMVGYIIEAYYLFCEHHIVATK